MLGRIVDGKYRLLRLVGEGGMGWVYEAEPVTMEIGIAVMKIPMIRERSATYGLSRGDPHCCASPHGSSPNHTMS